MSDYDDYDHDYSGDYDDNEYGGDDDGNDYGGDGYGGDEDNGHTSGLETEDYPDNYQDEVIVIEDNSAGYEAPPECAEVDGYNAYDDGGPVVPESLDGGNTVANEQEYDGVYETHSDSTDSVVEYSTGYAVSDGGLDTEDYPDNDQDEMIISEDNSGYEAQEAGAEIDGYDVYDDEGPAVADEQEYEGARETHSDSADTVLEDSTGYAVDDGGGLDTENYPDNDQDEDNSDYEAQEAGAETGGYDAYDDEGPAEENIAVEQEYEGAYETYSDSAGSVVGDSPGYAVDDGVYADPAVVIEEVEYDAEFNADPEAEDVADKNDAELEVAEFDDDDPEVEHAADAEVEDDAEFEEAEIEDHPEMEDNAEIEDAEDPDREYWHTGYIDETGAHPLDEGDEEADDGPQDGAGYLEQSGYADLEEVYRDQAGEEELDEGDYASSYGDSDNDGYYVTPAQAAYTSAPSISDTPAPPQLCVVCNSSPVYSRDDAYRFVTCSEDCLSTLCNRNWVTSQCSYCHVQPRLDSPHSYTSQSLQCSQSCIELALDACLMCRCRPANSPHDFCGRTCRKLAVQNAPTQKIIEVPRGHHSFQMVDDLLRNSWHNHPGATASQAPRIRHIYKVVETSEFLQPYNEHRKRVGNQQFRFHGTTRGCLLGATPTETNLCTRSDCAVCNILRTSFRVSLARQSGAFGQGIYTSSASNKAFGYSQNTGVLLLNKAALGREYHVSAFAEVTALPTGYDSVVFDRMNGALNETILYDDAAIRPVFLIVF